MRVLFAALGAASGYHVLPNLPHASRASPLWRQCAASRSAFPPTLLSDSADDDASRPMIGGLLAEDGDPILCRDDASNAWWRATVRDTRGSEVLVHFSGCDDAWDEWMEASSPNLMRMDSVEVAKDRSAFQMDTYEEELDSEELLEQYRAERWDNNAKWQLTTFAEAQMGSWEGEIELYEADGKGGVRRVVGPWQPKCSSVAEVATSTGPNQEVELVDTLPLPAAGLAFSQRMGAAAFRPEKGNMAVAGAYSLAAPQHFPDSSAQAESGEAAGQSGIVLEVSLREEARRVRCKFLYTRDESDESAGGEASGGAAAADEEAAPPRMSIKSMAVLREVSGGGEFVDNNAGSGDIDGTPGRGLYDPPLGDKTGYISLYCEGGVTVVFPTVVESGAPGVVSLDWIAGLMRYQVDRKFKKLDGSLSSLELTEIQKKDAEVVLPNFPHQNQGQAEDK